MKVLFVYPDLNIDVGWQGHYYEGVASLSAILKSRGHEVELAHIYNLSKGKDIINRISGGFDLVAFSSTTPMFPYVQYCSRRIKKELGSKIPLLCGGAHATSAPEETLINSDVDYACVGEGENFIIAFLDYLRGLRHKTEIKNLAYKNESGEVVVNNLEQAIDPLDALPFPDRGLFDLQHRNTDVACVSAGRGCPYQCAYCSNNYLNKIYKNKYLRFRAPRTVINEIQLLLQEYPHLRQLAFLDDVFILDDNWLSDFCRLYAEHIKLPFRALAHPNAITREKIKALKDAGCNEIGFGIQSGNEFIRNSVMLRHVSDNKIKESIAILKDYNMKFVVDIIFGVPLEQKRHMLDTIKMCAKNNVEAKSHIFYPLPNTRLEQLSIEKGLFEKNIYGEDYHSKTILKYSALHKARVLFFHRYFRPLISAYRSFAFNGSGLIPKSVRTYLLDNILCSDFTIYSIMKMRSGFIKVRSFIRKISGIQEFRLDQICRLRYFRSLNGRGQTNRQFSNCHI